MYSKGNGLDHRSGAGALNGVHLCSEWPDSAVLLRYSGQFVGSSTVTARVWIRGQVLVHLMVFICVVSRGQCNSVELEQAVGWFFYSHGNGLDQRSGTGALNGVHLCSEWADSAVLLRYSGPLFGSCTVTPTAWIRRQVLVHLTVFICVVIRRTVQFFEI